jgi:FAD/FMN-containing dehydrogenase
MSLSHESIEALRDAVTGPVFVRGDEEIAAEVASMNLTIVSDPEVVVGVTSEADVVAAVNFAVANKLAVRVQATGHNATLVSDGLLITTSRLSDVSVDPSTRLARIGAGAKWVPVVAAAAEHGLAPIAGSSTHVGAVGFVLGGGLGPLVRSHGFGSDWVRGFRVVTATGETLTLNADENAELFWALRGGKGGVGVVTELTVELVELATIYGGSLMFDAAHIETVFRAWLAWIPTAPETDSTSIAVMRVPDLEFVPAPLRGRTLLHLRLASIADPDVAAASFAPLIAAAPSFLGGVGELPTSALDTIHNDPTEPSPSWVTGRLLNPVDDAFADAFLAAVGAQTAVPFISVELRHLGGAAARDVPEGSAVGGRGGAFTLSIVGLAAPGVPEAATATIAQIAPWISAEANVNFGENSPTSIPLWPAAIAERLTAVRSSIDPDGVFQLPRWN